MAIMILVGILCIGLFLMAAGAAEIERRAEAWDRYQRAMHPPDDDGVSILEEAPPSPAATPPQQAGAEAPPSPAATPPQQAGAVDGK